MSTYYKVVCHDCKKQVDMAGFADDYVVKVVGEWARYKHIGCKIAVLHDITGWDDEYDKLYYDVEDYEEVKCEE